MVADCRDSSVWVNYWRTRRQEKTEKMQKLQLHKNGVLTNRGPKSKLETDEWNTRRRKKKLCMYKIAAVFSFCSLNFAATSESGRCRHVGKLWYSLWLLQASDRTELIHSSYTYIYLCTQSINKTTKWEPKDYRFIHFSYYSTPNKRRHNQPGRVSTETN